MSYRPDNIFRPDEENSRPLRTGVFLDIVFWGSV